MNTIDRAHGGDITGFALEYGREPLDFSASLNPLGMPEEVKRAIIQGVERAYAYPDPYARELTAALAEKLQIPPQNLILGNGAADLIHRYVHAIQPQNALLPIPSFSEYERALHSLGCNITYYSLDGKKHFDLDEDFLECINEDVDVLFLCQPGNPTGRIIVPELLDPLLDKCLAANTKVLLDECFLSFVDCGNEMSRAKRIWELPNVFILGSFTKLYGIAGLRLGYGLCSDKVLLGNMTLNSQAWAVSTLAQIAGVAALTQDEYVKCSLALIAEEKEWLISALDGLGIFIIGSEANYLFFYTDDIILKEKLAEKGILIRDCANFPGLRPGYYRIAVRKREENIALIKAMKEVWKEGLHDK